MLQEAYLKVLEENATYSEKSNFKTWLFSIIRFTAIDNLKGSAVFSSFVNMEQEVAEQALYHERNYEQLLAQLYLHDKGRLCYWPFIMAWHWMK
ncbi:MAG: DNA-directed RNA polymerase specialized sigma24 family protein [Algoriphagus sp.]|jgi:DNA-directed RNA polymerase specialized sigma24 family protein